MTTTEKNQKDKRALSIIYIIAIIILAILAIGGSLFIYRTEYIAGTRNDVHHGAFYGFGLFLILSPIILSIAGLSSIVALISLILRHKNIGQIILKLALIFLGPAIVFFAFNSTSPAAPIFLKGFNQWVLQEVDIDAIQKWLVDEGENHAGQHYASEDGLPEELPECLVKLRPRRISFSYSTTQNEPKIEIVWYYVMDEYGLIIGSASMETPEEGCPKVRKGYYEFRRPVKPGAYVFIRD
jgi:hypothetical protein